MELEELELLELELGLRANKKTKHEMAHKWAGWEVHNPCQQRLLRFFSSVMMVYVN